MNLHCILSALPRPTRSPFNSQTTIPVFQVAVISSSGITYETRPLTCLPKEKKHEKKKIDMLFSTLLYPAQLSLRLYIQHIPQ